VIVAVIVVLGLLRGQPFVEMLLFALRWRWPSSRRPAGVVTISLALGVQKLVKRRALMRRLAAVETARQHVGICSDRPAR